MIRISQRNIRCLSRVGEVFSAAHKARNIIAKRRKLPLSKQKRKATRTRFAPVSSVTFRFS